MTVLPRFLYICYFFLSLEDFRERLSPTVTLIASRLLKIRFQAKSMNQHPFFRLAAREICRLNGGVKICGASRILTHLIAIAAVGVINLARLRFVGRIDFAAVIQEVGQPIVVLLVFLDGIPYHFGLDNFEIACNDTLCALDNPLKDCAARRFEQEVRIVLDVSFTLNLGVEGDHDEDRKSTRLNS